MGIQLKTRHNIHTHTHTKQFPFVSPVAHTHIKNMSTTKAVQAGILLVNFICVIITCYIFDMNKWIGNDKADRSLQDNRFYQGFWRKCVYKTVTKEHTCDTIREWFFSPNLPSWVISGRLMVGFAILGGFISTIGFLLGSELSSALKSSTKQLVKRLSGISMVINGCLMFVLVARSYNANTIGQIAYGCEGCDGANLVPSRATYGAIALGCIGFVNGLVATCFGAKKHEYEQAGYN